MKQLLSLVLLAGIAAAQPPGPRGFPGRGAMGGRGGAQQQPQTPAPPVRPEDLGSIEGQVVNAVSGEPLRKATVTLRKFDGRGQAVATTSDAAGQFALRGVEPGQYRLSAERNGFVRQEYGARASGRSGTVLALGKAQRLTAISLALSPQAVIAGRITDEDGEPLKHVSVQALRVAYNQGQRQLQPVESNQTNDLGEYRLYDLPAGKYYLSAAFRNPAQALGSSERYIPVYYPGTNDPASAMQLYVSAGTQMRGADLTMRRSPTVTVRGRVIDGATNAPPRNVTVRLAPRGEAFTAPLNQAGAGRGQNGGFEISGVTPGSYTLIVNTAEQRQRSVYRQPLEVGSGGLDGLVITLPVPSDLAGILRAEGQADAIDLSKLTITLRLRDPLPVGANPVKVSANGEFTIQGVMPDNYDIQIYGLSPGYYLKSVRLGAAEVLESGLSLTGGVSGKIEVTVSPAAAQIEGTVTGADSQPARGATIALVPDGERRSRPWFYRTTRADDSGHYTLQGIVPGGYTLYAFDDLDPGAYYDPDFIRTVERSAESVSLRENSRETRALKVTSILASQ